MIHVNIDEAASIAHKSTKNLRTQKSSRYLQLETATLYDGYKGIKHMVPG